MSEEKKDEDLQTQVREWLQREGYPFEMKVAQAFAKAGFYVNQAEYYEDPETHVEREIDVVARVWSCPGEVFFSVIFLLECKSSLDKPWLLFCKTSGGGLAPPGRVLHRISGKAGTYVLSELAADPSVQNLPMFNLRPPVAYGLGQAFLKEKNQKDLAYTAMCSVANAAKAAAEKSTKRPLAPSIVELIFPVIVVDGRLFQCWLDEASVLSVNEVACGTLLWHTSSGFIVMDVQTGASVEEFAAECFESARRWLSDYYERASKILQLRAGT